jgi:hypothetical protein
LKKNGNAGALLISLAMFCSFDSYSQHEIKKIHSWFEPVTAGIEAKENIAKKDTPGNWKIFIESKSKKLNVEHLWINKEEYTFSANKVESPVILENQQQSGIFMKKDTTILVPRTKNTLYQLILRSDIEPLQPKLKVPASFDSFIIVVEYSIKKKKKKKYSGTKDIKYLSPVSLY